MTEMEVGFIKRMKFLIDMLSVDEHDDSSNSIWID